MTGTGDVVPQRCRSCNDPEHGSAACRKPEPVWPANVTVPSFMVSARVHFQRHALPALKKNAEMRGER